MNKVVKYASVHQDIFLPGVGSLGRTLTNDITGKTRDLKMTLVEEGLLLDIKGVSAVIPLPNIVVMVLAETPKATK